MRFPTRFFFLSGRRWKGFPLNAAYTAPLLHSYLIFTSLGFFHQGTVNQMEQLHRFWEGLLVRSPVQVIAPCQVSSACNFLDDISPFYAAFLHTGMEIPILLTICESHSTLTLLLLGYIVETS